MSVIRLNGATVEFASAYGTSIAYTSVTNASPSVVTLGTGHSIGTGDYFEFLTSGWDRLQGVLARCSVSTSTQITAEGINTTSTTFYPGGTAAAAGNVREVSTWTPITQVYQDAGVAMAGGDQQYDTYGFLSSDLQFQAPSIKSPIVATIKVYHDPSASWLSLAQARDVVDETTGLRITTRSGGKILLNGYMRLGVPVPEGNFWSRTVTLSAVAPQTEYTT